MNEKTVVLDFDGVLHSYKTGWHGANVITDEPTPEALKLLRALKEAGYKIVIQSVRATFDGGALAIDRWLKKYEMRGYVDNIVAEKTPAIAYVDDRGVLWKNDVMQCLKEIKELEHKGKACYYIEKCPVGKTAPCEDCYQGVYSFSNKCLDSIFELLEFSEMRKNDGD